MVTRSRSRYLTPVPVEAARQEPAALTEAICTRSAVPTAVRRPWGERGPEPIHVAILSPTTLTGPCTNGRTGFEGPGRYKSPQTQYVQAGRLVDDPHRAEGPGNYLSPQAQYVYPGRQLDDPHGIQGAGSYRSPQAQYVHTGETGGRTMGGGDVQPLGPRRLDPPHAQQLLPLAHLPALHR